MKNTMIARCSLIKTSILYLMIATMPLYIGGCCKDETGHGRAKLTIKKQLNKPLEDTKINLETRGGTMDKVEYTVATDKSFDEAVFSVEIKSKEKGFSILHVHDVGNLLTSKGFARPPLKIIEICNAKYASQVLAKDIRVALMLPCPITVYVEGEKTYISALRPRMIAGFYPEANIVDLANEVDRIVVSIVNEAK
ncbi:MAG: DUF302 domain-containing protein [Elusimicrobiota bacterium]